MVLVIAINIDNPIWPIYETLTDTPIQGQNERRSNGNEEELHISVRWRSATPA